MSNDYHPLNDLLSPLVDGDKQRQYPHFVASLAGLSIVELLSRLHELEILSWQWHEVFSHLRSNFATLDWNDVVVFRENRLVQLIVEDRLRQIASERDIGWLFGFLAVPSTVWVSNLLSEELRKRVVALKTTEPIPAWFTEKLQSAREHGERYLGLFERKALQMMHEEALANMED